MQNLQTSLSLFAGQINSTEMAHKQTNRQVLIMMFVFPVLNVTLGMRISLF